MKVVIQVVKEANVKVDSKVVGKINKGYLLLVGLEVNDTYEIVDKVASKIINLRINKDDNMKTNLSLKDVNGEILSISQFTLAATLDSRRPSFTNAMPGSKAIEYYEYFNKLLENEGFHVEKGIFGAMMDVSLINDGPFTIVVDSKDFIK